MVCAARQREAGTDTLFEPISRLPEKRAQPFDGVGDDGEPVRSARLAVELGAMGEEGK